MSSFSCPHYDGSNDACIRIRTDCVPGRAGCVVPKGTRFLVPAEERVKQKAQERADESGRHACAGGNDVEGRLR